MAHIDPSVLEAAGFTDDIQERQTSVVMNLAGPAGSGKTTWGLTAPKPLLYQATDFGDDGVIQAAPKGQIIRPNSADYKLIIPHEFRAFVDKTETDQQRKQREGRLANYVHDKFYMPFRKDFEAGIKAGVKSVVWDTHLEIWEFIRLSVYGREATNRSDLQAEANAKMKEMIRLATANNVNLILINRLKNKWESYYDQSGNVKWRKNENEWEMQGYDKTPELVAVSLWTHFDPENKALPFKLTVRKNRTPGGAAFVGQTYPSMPFVDMMGVLIPGVDWEG